MNTKLLQWIGLAAILACLGGSIAALTVVQKRIQVTIQEEQEAGARGPDPIDLARADVADLRGDVALLSAGVGEKLGELHQALTQDADERAHAVSKELSALQREVARLQEHAVALERQSAQLRDQLALLEARGGATSVPGAELFATAPVLAAEPAAVEATAVQPPSETVAPRKSFLSFQLPSQSFSFEGRQKLAIVPSLSRVGFDAKSTLHDFSGVTQKIDGELVVDLAHPERAATGRISVRAESLDTGVEDRDAEMRQVLGVEKHSALTFTWKSFEPAAVDAGALTVAGVAKGELSIHGVAREIAMPVKVSVDASKRVAIEGEIQLRMSDFGVVPPSKLGVISVEDQVKVWIALRARSMGAVPEARVGN